MTNHTLYQAYYTNFGFSDYYDTEKEARAAITKSNFFATIYKGEVTIAQYSPIKGWIK